MSSMLTSRNPFTGAVLAEYPVWNKTHIEAQLAATRKAFDSWCLRPWKDRAAVFVAVSKLLLRDKQRFAELMTQEMGKPITQAKAEVEKCSALCRYYAEHTPSLLYTEHHPQENGFVDIAVEPLGTLLAIMPWNFPFWQAFRAAIPALAIGNTVLLKHASNVTGSAFALQELFAQAGLPQDVFAVLPVPSAGVGDIIAHPLVAAVTFTGSTEAGRKVAAQAGRFLKKTVLELGGSDPYIILEDADIEKAAKICFDARMINNGQSCIAAKRFIVVDSVYDAFREAFRAHFSSVKMGDPMDNVTALGPLVHEEAALSLQKQVEASLANGATSIAGEPYLGGAFFPATLLEGVRPGQPAYAEELFGPVASLIRGASEAEALHIANDVTFGLGAAIFSRDTQRASELAKRHLQAGSCFVNAQVKSDPRFPFGGVKESGYGRELSHHGLHEFANIKTVWVENT